MKAVKDSVHNLLSSLIRYPLILLTSVIITRFLGPENKGILVFMIMMGGVILPICFMGIGNGIQYYTSNKTYAPRDSIFSTIVVGLTTGLFVAILITVLWKFELFGKSGNSVPLKVLLCFVLMLPLDGLTYTTRILLIGDSQFKFYNYLEIANSFFTSILMLLFLFAFEDDLFGVSIARCVIKLALAGFLMKFLIQEYMPKLMIDIKYLKSIYNYGLKSWLGNLSARANDQLDQLIIGFFLGPAGLGVYAVAYSIANLLLIPSNAISPVLFNEISRQRDLYKSLLMTAQIHRSLFIVVLIISITMAISSYWLIPLFYGADFSGAYVPLLIILPGIIFYTVTRRILQKFLAANGLPLKTSLVQLIAAIIGVIFYMLLIPKYGIIGAAFGSTIAYITSMIVAYVFTRKLVNTDLNLFRLSKSDIFWLIQKLKGTSLKNM